MLHNHAESAKRTRKNLMFSYKQFECCVLDSQKKSHFSGFERKEKNL